MSKLPNIILLDLDNTVYSYDPCHKAALQKVELYAQEAIKLSGFTELYNRARKEVHIRLRGTASSHNRLLYFHRLLELAGHGTKIKLAIKLNELYWDSFIEHVEIFDGVYSFLEAAKTLNIPVVVVTDLTADIQLRKILSFKMENLLSAIATSEEAGRDKPDSAIFEIALNKVNSKRESIWMIGDSLKKDIEGGKAIGATTFLKLEENQNKNALAKPTVDHTFESFHELTNILTHSKNAKL